MIGALDAAGCCFCEPECQARRLAVKRREIEPIELQIKHGADDRRWVKVLIIPVRDPDDSGLWLVHCVLDEERSHRIESYLSRIASRTRTPGVSKQDIVDFHLTDRQRQILELLVEDESLHAIASKLGVSHATVRNHVQHILGKLGVHSIMEAVAYYLLTKD